MDKEGVGTGADILRTLMTRDKHAVCVCGVDHHTSLHGRSDMAPLVHTHTDALPTHRRMHTILTASAIGEVAV